MKIKEITLHHLKMDLLYPFVTSFGAEYDKDFILVEVKNEDGLTAWAENVAMPTPYYNEETVKTNWHILEDYLIPILLNTEFTHPDQISEKFFAHIRGNYMAKASLEMAAWDL